MTLDSTKSTLKMGEFSPKQSNTITPTISNRKNLTLNQKEEHHRKSAKFETMKFKFNQKVESDSDNND